MIDDSFEYVSFNGMLRKYRDANEKIVIDFALHENIRNHYTHLSVEIDPTITPKKVTVTQWDTLFNQFTTLSDQLSLLIEGEVNKTVGACDFIFSYQPTKDQQHSNTCGDRTVRALLNKYKSDLDLHLDIDFLFVENHKVGYDFNAKIFNAFAFLAMGCYDRTFLKIKNFLMDHLKLNEKFLRLSIQSKEDFIENLSDGTVFLTTNIASVESINVEIQPHSILNKHSMFCADQPKTLDSKTSYYKHLVMTVTGVIKRVAVFDNRFYKSAAKPEWIKKKVRLEGDKSKAVSFIIEEGKEYRSMPYSGKGKTHVFQR